MARKTYAQGRTIGHHLWCAAAPERIAWQWNALIARRGLPRCWFPLLPSGTGTNESLHAEINKWWRNSPEQFPTTLQLHLRIGHFGKLLAHNAALYAPTLRQVSHDQTLVLALRSVVFAGEPWRMWWDACEGVGALPLFGERTDLQRRLAADGKQCSRQTTTYRMTKKRATMRLLRRPAGILRVEAVKRPAQQSKRDKVRRTPFTLKRRAL